MKKDRFIKIATQVLNKENGNFISEKEFIHLAQLSKLIDKDSNDYFKQKIDEGISPTKCLELIWERSGATSGKEGTYILEQLNYQLQQKVIELYAFQDTINQSGIEPMTKIKYENSKFELQTLREDFEIKPNNDSNTESFPDSREGYLVVPWAL